ncbi:uncharacterized protein C8Q71DRAFT_361961 [Rhodofomes roseus]|uniref:Uncharacterized protein n=1 Tax=Rhodofomes roseus TaxID=34475 RepID=A0ABQ8K1Q2_9APHY|nr:uncharacterized protein C8Q71DRAFT_361961 [Rhodofomes roseus]KAH9830646.1 hypothetical protein C8Q71DRAFT_361961 [Rhodofomes roseus]
MSVMSNGSSRTRTSGQSPSSCAVVDKVVFWPTICARYVYLTSYLLESPMRLVTRSSNAAPDLAQELIKFIAHLPLRPARAARLRVVLLCMPCATTGSAAALHDLMQVLVSKQSRRSYSCAFGEPEHSSSGCRLPALEHLAFTLLDWALRPAQLRLVARRTPFKRSVRVRNRARNVHIASHVVSASDNSRRCLVSSALSALALAESNVNPHRLHLIRDSPVQQTTWITPPNTKVLCAAIGVTPASGPDTSLGSPYDIQHSNSMST